jgi:hypothetical protein
VGREGWEWDEKYEDRDMKVKNERKSECKLCEEEGTTDEYFGK